MRLLYVDPLGGEGGLGGYSSELVNAYVRAGHSVTVATSRAAAAAGFPEGCDVQPIFGRAFDRDLAAWRRAAAYFLGNLLTVRQAARHDVVLHHLPHVPPLDAATLWALRRVPRPVAMVVHDPRSLRDAPLENWYRWYFQQGGLLFVHGPVARADVLAHGVDPARVCVVQHGDFAPRVPLSQSKALATLGLSAPLRHPVGLIVGNLKPGKGIRRVVTAAEAVGMPLGTLMIAGKPQNDDDLARFLGRHSPASLDVRAMLQRLTPEQEFAVYSLADVVLALYDSGYSSGVVATAHSLGTPVLLTDVGDLALQAGPNDILLPPNWAASDLSNALEKCLSRTSVPADDRLRRSRRDSAATPWDDHVERVCALVEP
jgi:glycosyltransferase involved in cell wall biosynthesis